MSGSQRHFILSVATFKNSGPNTYGIEDNPNTAYFVVNAENGNCYYYPTVSSSPEEYHYDELRRNIGVSTSDGVFNFSMTQDNHVTARVYHVPSDGNVPTKITEMDFNLEEMLSLNVSSLGDVNTYMNFQEFTGDSMVTGGFSNTPSGFALGEQTHGHDYQFKYHSTDGEFTGNWARFYVKRGAVTMQPTDLTATMVPQQNNLTFSGKSTVVTVNFNKNILTNLTESSFVVTGGGTISNVQINGDICTFTYTAPDNTSGAATISLAAGVPEGEDYSTTANSTSTQVNYNTTESDPSSGPSESVINFSMRVCTISKENGTRSNTLFTGAVGNSGFQNYSLRAIQFIIHNIFDKTYEMSLPRDGLMFFYLPTGSTQPEALSSNLLSRFLLKQNDLTEADTTSDNATLSASSKTVKMFDYIAGQLFPVLRKGGKIVSNGENTTLDFCETQNDEGKLRLVVKNCLFELSLSF